MPPKLWIKKINSAAALRIIYMRYAYNTLAVAMALSHWMTINSSQKHNSFAPFQAHDNTKVFSFRGEAPLTS